MPSRKVWLASFGLAAGLHASMLLPGFTYLLHRAKPLPEQIAPKKTDARHFNRKLAAMGKEEFLRTLEKDMVDGRLDSMSFADFFLRAESYFYANDLEVFIAASDRYYKMQKEINAAVDGITDPVKKALAIQRLVNIVYHKKYKEEAGRVVEDVHTLEWNCGSKTHALIAFLIGGGVPRGLLGVRAFADPHQQPALWTRLGWLDFSVTKPEVFRETRERVHPVHILVASYLQEQGRTLPKEYAEIWKNIKPKEESFPNNARGVVANYIPAEKRMYKTYEEMRAAIAAANEEVARSAEAMPRFPSPDPGMPAGPPAGTQGVAYALPGEPWRLWLPGLALQPLWEILDGKTNEDVEAILHMKRLVMQLRQELGAVYSNDPETIAVQLIDLKKAAAVLDSMPVEQAKQAFRTIRLDQLGLEFETYIDLLQQFAPENPVVKKWTGELAEQMANIRMYRASLGFIQHSHRRSGREDPEANQRYQAYREPVLASFFTIMGSSITPAQIKAMKGETFWREQELQLSQLSFEFPDLAAEYMERMDPTHLAFVWPEFLEKLLEFNPGIVQKHPIVGKVIDAHIEAIRPEDAGSLPRAVSALRLLLTMQPVDADRIVAFFDLATSSVPLLDGVAGAWKQITRPLLYGIMDHPELLYDPRIRAHIQRVIAEGEYPQIMDDRIFVPYFAQVLRETAEM